MRAIFFWHSARALARSGIMWRVAEDQGRPASVSPGAGTEAGGIVACPCNRCSCCLALLSLHPALLARCRELLLL